MSDINRTASAFLAELERGGGIHLEVLTVSHVTREIAPSEYEETAADFLERMKREFDKIPDAMLEVSRIDVETPKVILAYGARYFNGFLKQKAVFGFDLHLALELTNEEADKVQGVLTLLGHETARRPSLTRKVSSF